MPSEFMQLPASSLSVSAGCCGVVPFSARAIIRVDIRRQRGAATTRPGKRNRPIYRLQISNFPLRLGRFRGGHFEIRPKMQVVLHWRLGSSRGCVIMPALYRVNSQVSEGFRWAKIATGKSTCRDNAHSLSLVLQTRNTRVD